MALKREISDLFNALLSKDSNTLKSRLAKGAAGIFILKIISRGISFLSVILLARMLEADGYGLYSYVMSLIALLGIPSLGFDRLLIRDVSAYSVRSEWGFIKGLLRWTNLVAIIISGIIVLISITITLLFHDRFNPEIISPFITGLFLLPLMALIRLRQTTLQGLHMVVEGQIPEMLIQPTLFILIVSIIYLMMNSINVTYVVGINLISASAAFLTGVYLLRRNLPPPVMDAVPLYKKDEWLRVALQLFFLSVVLVINDKIDILLLGILKGTYEVGIFTVALRGVELITFPLIAVNTTIAPAVSSLYASNDMERLQRLITKSARLMLLFSLPVTLLFIVSGRWFLLIFGHEFTKGSLALAIMSGGQLFNVSMGSVGLLLTMTGNERFAVLGMVVAVIFKIILAILLVPLWGVNGSAIAWSLSMVTWNIILSVWVYKKLGIHSTVLGKIV